MTIAEAALGVFPIAVEDGDPVCCKRGSGGSAISKRNSNQLSNLSMDVTPVKNSSFTLTPMKNSPFWTPQWTNNKRDSSGSSPSSIFGTSGNPFEYYMNTIDFSLTVQDTAVTIPFDKLVSQIALHYPHWPHLAPSVELKDFVCACVNFNPFDRPTCRELLRHPFLNSVNDDRSSTITLLRKWFDHMGIEPVG
jgi:serine/threonine protein kinase